MSGIRNSILSVSLLMLLAWVQPLTLIPHHHHAEQNSVCFALLDHDADDSHDSCSDTSCEICPEQSSECRDLMLKQIATGVKSLRNFNLPYAVELVFGGAAVPADTNVGIRYPKINGTDNFISSVLPLNSVTAYLLTATGCRAPNSLQ